MGAEIHNHLHLLRSTDGGSGTQGGQVMSVSCRMFGKGEGNVWRAVKYGTALFLDQAQGLAGVEMVLQHHCATMG